MLCLVDANMLTTLANESCHHRHRRQSKSDITLHHHSIMNIKRTSNSIHYVAPIMLLITLFYSSTQSSLTLEIISQREPGEATNSLIQQSGLLTNAIRDELVLSGQTNNADLVQSLGNNDATTQLEEKNKSSNNSNELDKEEENGDEREAIMMVVIIANILIFFIGLCGNAVVILVILKFTKIETVTDIYILNLAFADLMFITGLIFLITTMFVSHWVFGNLMCKMYMATTSLNQFASSLLLVVMSFDRFLAVCHPIYAQRFRRLRRAKIICLCIWIVCLILMTPIFAFAKISDNLTCAIFWPDYKSFNCEVAFTLYSFAIGFAVPLLLIAAFYLCVIRKLRMSATGPISMGSSRRSKSRESTNRRIEHLVIGIICTYTICWLPYWIAQLCIGFTSGDHSPVAGFYEFYMIATCLSYTNSALNPLLYAFLSDNFKRRFSEIIRSIYSIKWCQRGSERRDSVSHRPVSTAACCEFETSRPESRQTVILNESVRLIPSPIFNPVSKICDPTEKRVDAQAQAQIALPRPLLKPSTVNEELVSGCGDTLDACLDTNHHHHQYHHQTKKSVAFDVNTIFIQGINDTTEKHHKI